MTFSIINITDLGILLIIGLSVLVGILRGATREILGIGGWIGAFATVFYGFPFLRPLGHRYIHNPMISDAVVGGLLFIVSLAVFIVISRNISSRVKGSLLSGLDRSLGLVFGFLRGLFVVCLIYLVMGLFYLPQPLPDSVRQAHFIPWVAQGADALKGIIPPTYLPPALSSLKEGTQDIKNLTKESHEDIVKNLSTLNPISKIKNLEKLIEKNDSSTQE